MDICSKEDPPAVGEPDNFSLCWWTAKQMGSEKFETAKKLQEAVQ